MSTTGLKNQIPEVKGREVAPVIYMFLTTLLRSPLCVESSPLPPKDRPERDIKHRCPREDSYTYKNYGAIN